MTGPNPFRFYVPSELLREEQLDRLQPITLEEETMGFLLNLFDRYTRAALKPRYVDSLLRVEAAPYLQALPHLFDYARTGKPTTPYDVVALLHDFQRIVEPLRLDWIDGPPHSLLVVCTAAQARWRVTHYEVTFLKELCVLASVREDDVLDGMYGDYGGLCTVPPKEAKQFLTARGVPGFEPPPAEPPHPYR
jgi:hypothetical protein